MERIRARPYMVEISHDKQGEHPYGTLEHDDYSPASADEVGHREGSARLQTQRRLGRNRAPESESITPNLQRLPILVHRAH